MRELGGTPNRLLLRALQFWRSAFHAFGAYTSNGIYPVARVDPECVDWRARLRLRGEGAAAHTPRWNDKVLGAPQCNSGREWQCQWK